MSTILNSKHGCHQGNDRDRYIIILYNEEHDVVFVGRKDEHLYFPHLKCPEIPSHGLCMTTCISERFEEMLGVKYELTVLYSSEMGTPWSEIRWPCEAIFEVISPLDPSSRDSYCSLSVEYQWMSLSTIWDSLTHPKTSWTQDACDFSAFQALLKLKDRSCQDNRIRPWMRPNWYTETTAEATKVLKSRGYSVNDRFAQLSMTSGSALLAVETDGGRVYLKASSRKEVMVTALVATFAPNLVRSPIFVNEEKEWMLMSDYGRTMEDEEFGLVEFDKLCVPLGKLHLESQKHIDKLKEVGVPVVSAESWIQRTRSMLENESVRRTLKEFGDNSCGTKDDKGRLKVYSETICEFLRELYENWRCLLSLTHGDIHRGNMIKSDDGGCLFIDWENASIDFPIADVSILGSQVIPVADRQRCNREPYFRLWEQHMSLSDFDSLWWCLILRDLLGVVLDTFESAVSTGRKPVFEKEDADRLSYVLVEIWLEMENRKA